jgi:mono/diheme cytochrome c family protein
MRSIATPTPHLAGLVMFSVVAALSGCGGDARTTTEIVLSPAAERGRQVARDGGCAACHGADGGGATGPAWTDLYLRDVELDDGSTVLADDAYLIESITDPRVKVVEGYSVPMPDNDLDDAEVAAVIEYIKALSPPSSVPAAGSQP